MSKILSAYLEAMAFTDMHSDSDDLKDATPDDLAPQARSKIEADCKAFEDRAAALIAQALTLHPDTYDITNVGHDFHYTRNGHGVGFWDRALGAIGDQLTAITETFGAVELYLGDDGKVHIFGV